MPLPLGHAAIGIAAHHIVSDGNRHPIDWKVVLLIMVLSNLPDLDVVLGLVLQNNGSAFHRGPTHSILFCLVGGYGVSLVAAWLDRTPVLSWQTCAAIIFSHVAADYFLTGAPVSFLWPLETYWSTGHARWLEVLHAVFFEAARDGAIVCVCALLMITTTGVRRWVQKISSKSYSLP